MCCFIFDGREIDRFGEWIRLKIFSFLRYFDNYEFGSVERNIFGNNCMAFKCFFRFMPYDIYFRSRKIKT